MRPKPKIKRKPKIKKVRRIPLPANLSERLSENIMLEKEERHRREEAPVTAPEIARYEASVKEAAGLLAKIELPEEISSIAKDLTHHHADRRRKAVERLGLKVEKFNLTPLIKVLKPMLHDINIRTRRAVIAFLGWYGEKNVKRRPATVAGIKEALKATEKDAEKQGNYSIQNEALHWLGEIEKIEKHA